MSPPVLTPDDARMILEELFEARNQSFVLGLALKLPFHKVKAIHWQYQNPRHCLLRVIIAFLKQMEPTWRDIVEALRSRAVNLPDLARRVEAAHIPDPTATRDVVPETCDVVPETNTGKSPSAPIISDLFINVTSSANTRRCRDDTGGVV